MKWILEQPGHQQFAKHASALGAAESMSVQESLKPLWDLVCWCCCWIWHGQWEGIIGRK